MLNSDIKVGSVISFQLRENEDVEAMRSYSNCRFRGSPITDPNDFNNWEVISFDKGINYSRCVQGLVPTNLGSETYNTIEVQPSPRDRDSNVCFYVTFDNEGSNICIRAKDTSNVTYYVDNINKVM